MGFYIPSPILEEVNYDIRTLSYKENPKREHREEVTFLRNIDVRRGVSFNGNHYSCWTIGLWTPVLCHHLPGRWHHQEDKIMTQQIRTFVIFCPCSGANPIRVTQFEKAIEAQCPYCGRYRTIPRGIGQVSVAMQKALFHQKKGIGCGKSI